LLAANLWTDGFGHVTDELERSAADAVEAVLREAGDAAPQDR